MKRILAMAISVILVASMAITGSIAYLKDDDGATNTMTIGSVYIDQIEQERDASGNLVKFTQEKPAFPAVGPIEWASKGVDVNGTEYKVFTEDLKNVVDKIVTVKNTGKSEAYIRTIVAIEAPEGDPNNLIHVNVNGDIPNTAWETITINDVDYAVSVFTYKEALQPGEISVPSLMQLFLDSEATNEDCEKFGDYWDVLVLSQAAQTAGFADANEALDAAFGDEEDDANIQKWFANMATHESANSEEFKAAVTANAKSIVVSLEGDVTYDIKAWQNNAMGGESTETITILGNGHTLTFNQLDSDWDNVATNNGAKLILKDVNITSSGHNDGPWNRHDINFGCDVELVNVNSDKALAFKAGATLKNVTINDKNTSDTYAIWIQPNGQTVDIDGLVIDMYGCADGRGIKIDEQYVDAPAKVILNVKNATFKTEEKGAIIVKSVAGADITLKNVDISGALADTKNAVWVDEASADYAALVNVTGGDKIVEGQGTVVPNTEIKPVATKVELQNALTNAADGTKIILADDISGTVTAPQAPGVGVTIDGEGNTFGGVITVDGKSGTYTTAGLTIKNVNFKADSISADACIQLGKDNNTRYTCNVTIENCTFDVPGAVGIKSYTGGDKNVVIRKCTAGKDAHSLLQLKGVDGVLVENCKAYSKNGMNFNNSTNVTIDSCVANVQGYAVRFGESSGGTGAAETYTIKNSNLKSACAEDGDAVIILRGTADNATLTIQNTVLEGTPDILNTATGATVIK